MSKIVLIACILVFAGSDTLLSVTEPKATLEITFTGIRSADGLIAIGVENSPDGWPDEPILIPNWDKSKMVDGTMTVVVKNLDYGTYAISVMDDEDGDLEMDSFLGVPREGFGFSRNPEVKLGMPKFEECSFELKQAHYSITIEVRYIGKDKEDLEENESKKRRRDTDT